MVTTVGKQLEILISELDVTKTAFAKELKVTQAYISKLINKGGAPSERLIDDICEKFDVNKEWLLHGLGKMKKEMSSSEKTYNRFGYMMDNATPTKKAAISMLLELVYRLPDDEWSYIMNQYNDALKETEKK